MNSAIITRLDRIQGLPTIPAVISKLERAVRDPEVSAATIAAIIEDDPSIITRIMKVVNSAFYGTAEKKTNSLHDAIVRLGMNAISNIALSTSVFSMFSRPGGRNFDRREFWHHCIATGIGVNVLHERCRRRLINTYSRDLLHLAGLVHDIGKIILEQHFHAEFSQALATATDSGKPLFEVEHELIETDHARIGAWLGEKWRLAPEILQCIRWHHDPGAAAPDYQPLVALCAAANHICNTQHIGNSGDNAAPRISAEVWQQLGLTPAEIPEIANQINTEAKKSEVLLAFA